MRDTPASSKLRDRDVFLVESLGWFRTALRHKSFSQVILFCERFRRSGRPPNGFAGLLTSQGKPCRRPASLLEHLVCHSWVSVCGLVWAVLSGFVRTTKRVLDLGVTLGQGGAGCDSD